MSICAPRHASDGLISHRPLSADEDITLIAEEDITSSYLVKASRLVENAQGAERERIGKYSGLMDLANLSARVFCEAVGTQTEETDYKRMGADLAAGFQAALTTLDYTPPSLSDEELRRLVPMLVPMLSPSVYADLRPQMLSELVLPLTAELTAPLEDYALDHVFDNLPKLVDPLVPLLQAPLMDVMSPPLVRTMQVVLHHQLLTSLLDPLTAAVLARISPHTPQQAPEDPLTTPLGFRMPKRSRSRYSLPSASGPSETGRS